MENKPIHVKPSLYAYYFLQLKEIALKYGYNLVLHGSLNRDLDLIAIPWEKTIGSHTEMVQEFADALGGYILTNSVPNPKLYSEHQHGRMIYIININRGTNKSHIDPKF